MLICLTLPMVFPVPAVAQSNDKIGKLQRSIVTMQLEMEEYQDELQNQLSEQREVLEQASTKLEELTRTNQVLQEQVKNLETRQALSEEKITDLRTSNSTTQFDELSELISAMMLAQLGDSMRLEEKLLSLLNEGNNLPADELILLLADSHKRRGALEESLGFYGLLISDHPGSDHINKAIFEASELLGQLDQKDQQLALLESLTESEGVYGKKARERFNSLSN